MIVEDAFEDAYADLFRQTYRVAFGILGSRPEAEDVVQETLVRAYVRWARIEPYRSAWTTRVAINLSLDHLRRSIRNSTTEVPSVPHHLDAADLDLRRALLRLTRRQREVVVLRYFLGFPEAEVSDALGCSVGSVKTHAHRGLRSLRKTLGETHAPFVSPRS